MFDRVLNRSYPFFDQQQIYQFLICFNKLYFITCKKFYLKTRKSENTFNGNYKVL